jgi:hypothetical protein
MEDKTITPDSIWCISYDRAILTSSIHHSAGRCSQISKARERNTGCPSWKEVKFLFADDMMLHVENPKDSSKGLLELRHKFSNVAEHKAKKNPAAFYILPTSYVKREIKKTMPFTTAIRKKPKKKNLSKCN